MAEPKRYWWLKLQKDFFKSKRIKKLRKLAGGDTYTIIYLKMQLLSLQTDGILYYSELEDSFAEEIALDIDEEPENVAVTIQYMLKVGLMETNDNTAYTLPFVTENIGSETVVAGRVREHRARLKTLQCNTNVTDVKQICNGEKEKEIEKDKEKDIYKGKKTEFFADVELNNAFNDYISMRKKIKKPLTDRAIQMHVNKLKQLATIPFSDEINVEVAIQIVDKAINKNWLDFYPLEEKKESKESKELDWSKI